MTSQPLCVENECIAIGTFPAGIQARTSSSSSCSDQTVLSTTNPSCEVECGPGYTPLTGTYECDTLSTGNTATTSLICEAKKCDQIGTFPTGVEGDSSSSSLIECTTSTSLYDENNSETPSSCAIKCMSGYSGGSGTYSCSTCCTATTSLTCTQNQCSAVSFNTEGMVRLSLSLSLSLSPSLLPLSRI